MLNENERKVLDYLKTQSPHSVSPTEIGSKVGGKTKTGLHRHSAWASPICQTLVKKGLVERFPNGWYRFVENE